MQLPGEGVWGEPRNRGEACAVLRRAVELGVRFIDTAWFYGPHVANQLIAEALHPYAKDLVVATKLGVRRTPDKGWVAFARPENLEEAVEHDLRELKLDVIDVAHLRFMAHSQVPFLESLDGMIALQNAGKIRHVALSCVGVSHVKQALARTSIVAVQNIYSFAGGGGEFAKRTHSLVEDPEGVVALCEELEIAFIPYFPMAGGSLGSALRASARKYQASSAQIALAWLLARSNVMLPIPGTTSIAHLEDNWNAQTIRLSPKEIDEIGKLARR